LVRTLELDDSRGIVVHSVERNSPAAQAGLQDGDVVIAIGERRTAGIDSLHRVLTELPLGQPLALDILRRNERLRLRVTPIESPAKVAN
ncbi:MAG: PDZ domain-containing protein, partial [Vulcanimicrobiaceae bacterium]